MALYPLRFQPLYKHSVWGGRRFESLLRRNLEPGDDFAESWEICDHGEDQSTVLYGPMAGATLQQLVIREGGDLLGRHHPQTRFPLLLKYLDARRRLSVQVHPDDATAARMQRSDAGKTEAWVVLQADAGSSIWAGFGRPVDRDMLRQAIAAGELEALLHHFQPRVGQCVFLPARTVHALGEGLLVVEVQQSSDLTFRLYDWNRVGADGRPRRLHIEEGLEAIDYRQGRIEPHRPQPTPRPHVERLVECEKFILDRWQFQAPQPAGGDRRCHLVTVLDGTIALEHDPSRKPLVLGDTALLPAAAGTIEITPLNNAPATLLDAYLP